jgi:NDP-sugar pyrophosphorylase family protein
MMLEALQSHPLASHIRISDERAYLRDTAGGLKFAEPFWQNSDLILIYNVDILSDIDLNKMIEEHIRHKAEATLAVRHRNTQRYFLFDPDERQLCGWKNMKSGEVIMSRKQENTESLAFSGIHVINTEFAHTIPTVEKSSITGFYLSQAANHRILGYLHDQDNWQDVGKYEEFRNLLS